MKVFTDLLEGRSFVYDGNKYSSGFGNYTKNGISISKEEYQEASLKYKEKEDIPFKPLKSLKECENYIHNTFGLTCKLSGITKKEVYNSCAESLHMVHKKYPLLFKSNSLKNFCTTKGLNELSIEKHKLPEEKIKEIEEKYLNEFKEKIDYFAKVGTPLSTSLTAISIHGLSRFKFRQEHGVTEDTVIDKKLSFALEETFKKIIRKQVNSSITSKSKVKMGSTKNTYAFYTPDEKYRGIYFVPANMKTCVEDYQKENYIHCKGVTHRSITIHELGHAMDNMLDLYHDEELKKIYKNYTYQELIENVSGYGATSFKEFIAECFSEYMDSETPREISTLVGKYIDKKYEAYKNKD